MREEDTPKERGEDAVIRYLKGCREGETGSDREGEDYGKDGCFARKNY